MLKKKKVLLVLMLVLNFFLVLLLGFFRLRIWAGSQSFQSVDAGRIIRWQISSLSREEEKVLAINDFFQDDQDIKNSERIRLFFGGDVMLGRWINLRSYQLNDYVWPLTAVAKVIRTADFAMVNLEVPLIENCPLTAEGMIFCGHPRFQETLLMAGVDAVGLANNHLLNYGFQGLAQTGSVMQRAGILPLEASQPVFRRIKGVDFVFLAENWTSSVNEETFMAIRHLEETVEVTVLFVHWGEEYTNQPTALQQQLAHRAIEAGADLVIGHHPHWLQPVEIYQGKPIFYSLGNLVFDQLWSLKTREGLILTVDFDKENIQGGDLIPVIINQQGQPQIAEGEEKIRILSELKEISFENRELN